MFVDVSVDANPKECDKTAGTKGKRRGPFQSAEQRELTALTRKMGACIRCSIHRIRCELDEQNPTGCCRACRQAIQGRPLWIPCLRYKITDSELLDNAERPRPTWTSRWKRMEMIDITNWASDEIKTIKVTQGVGNTWYALKVRQFVPVEGDALARRWVADGQKQEFMCTPYAVADMREAGRVLSAFSESTLKDALKFWLANGDTLLAKTYLMAYRYSFTAENEDDRLLLKSTMRLWGASRMMSRSAWICGEETLGMTTRDYGPNSPSTNRILMPPVFSAQMEIIFVAMILEPTKKEVLSRLKALIQDNTRNRRSWLAIYLCVFLLLHSCALLTARDNERARLQGVSERFYRPRVIEELHNGAKILLAYFHFCNRGSYPLYMDWTSEDQMFLAGLKKEQAEFLQFTVQEYKKKAPHFERILENNVYEDPYYFIAQMYERDWKPRHTKHTL
ncbi:uncharacterized protein EI97DRAFT_370279 [Westerdykella ornata]|uniref:Zn(2)-C6 fungal-type domain-containing protein n=1 Tax=Westerdykella ornata TaxID=318751 RepID=A0A6A6JRR2_WESOR|nr:uncharacterized protein EI97DRAFT_370279 [Westerdykella ornata]KAF2279311.1 hypothetical protein EI97DRAFT_370279 [Westerdykella ornata]